MENPHDALQEIEEAATDFSLPPQKILEQIQEAPENESTLPTLDKLSQRHHTSAPKHIRYLLKITDRIPRLPDGFGSGSELNRVRFARQLYPLLPKTVEQGKHVYVVTAPHSGWPFSWRHWSIYSQGCFYHLTADVPTKSTEQSNVSGLNPRAPKIKSKVQKDDLSTMQKDAYIQARNESSKKPFTMFEVGLTQYSPETIKKKADEIIEDLQPYDLLKRNCQVFAHILLYHILMAQRDCSIFVGNKTQFVDWELRGRLHSNTSMPNNADVGFLIRKPMPPTSKPWNSRYPFHYFTALDQTQGHAIRTLYQQGRLASGSKDPTGEHGAFGYAWYTLQSDLRDCEKGMTRALREFKEDIAAGNLKDAFYGREDTRQEQRKRLKEKKKNGREFTGVEMAISRFFSHCSSRTQRPSG